MQLNRNRIHKNDIDATFKATRYAYGGDEMLC